MSEARRLIGEILTEMGCVTQANVNTGLERQINGENLRLGEILVADGLCTLDDITTALAEQFHMEIVNLDGLDIPPEIINIVPETQCREFHVIPIGIVDGVLAVAVSDPLNLQPLDNIRFLINMPVEPVLAAAASIDAAIEEHYTRDKLREEMKVLSDTDVTFVNTEEERDKADQVNPDNEAPVVQLVNLLIEEAVRSRASDIHIEPMLSRLRVRYRIDGNCYEIDSPPKHLQGAIIARLKVMARMNMADRRRPQGGKIILKLFGRSLDLRVSTLPAQHGESLVLRILDKKSISFGLDQLGFQDGDLKLLRKLCRRPNGLVLITGPTGSGKTTTLYSALSELNQPDRKIITVEDPVEYTLSGINQCEVNVLAGLTFDKALKAILRQAPNVILIGEIRDQETAKVAIEASLTGHLVFATLHTIDAPSAVNRLIDMKIPPFLVASSILTIQAQRLVRTICPDCKAETDIDSVRLAHCGAKWEQFRGRRVYRGAGCNACRGTGFRGRKGIYEILVMNNRLRELAIRKATTDQLREQACRDGMHTLLDDGLHKVFDGWTTLDEVLAEAKLNS
jgi:type IV pilus assembly protein PilB